MQDTFHYSFQSLDHTLSHLLSLDHSQIDSNQIIQRIQHLKLQSQEAITLKLDRRIADWKHALAQLPSINIDHIELADHFTIQGQWQSDESHQVIRDHLMHVHPWRKGPFHLPSFSIDTEWRSDWKWDRVRPHLDSLQDKLVLDIGCGNGYYMWRMCGMGAKFVLGVDPTRVFHFQFHCFHQWLQSTFHSDSSRASLSSYPYLNHVYHLPLTLEHLVEVGNLPVFDYVFSMGVLYHRRDPLQHLQDIKQQMNPHGSTLILETLTHHGTQPLPIQGRYARMRNIWLLPDVNTLIQWMKQAGFGDIKVLDINQTTIEEQRSTDWMHFESLTQALDPSNPQHTIEGHPAPLRVIIMASI